MDNQDKAAWCEAGAKAEGDFVAKNEIDGWGISWNPDKRKDKYAHDLLGVIPMDLKTMKTPFRKAEALYGIPADRAITINEKDFIRYSENYPNILILCDVQYIGKQYILTLDRARRLLRGGKARRHEYKDRVGDEDGNAKYSYVFDVNDLDKLTGSKQHILTLDRARQLLNREGDINDIDERTRQNFQSQDDEPH